MTISERARPKTKAVYCPCCQFHLTGKTAPRSGEQLRRFFALMRVTFDNWPDSHERQFTDIDEMRAWLTIKAGYREVGARVPLAGLNKDRALFLVEASIRGSGSNAIPIYYDGEIIVFKPKSIAFQKMDHRDFCKLNDAVATVIEQETGLSVETLLKNAEAAA